MKKQKLAYERPSRPWDKERIEEEKKIMKDYGLRRKKEIWKFEAILRKYRRMARDLAANRDQEVEKTLITKLNKLGLVKPDANLDDILALTLEKILDRRLQTIVVRRALANTSKQARQFIVHGHIALDGQRTRWPSTLIPLDMEGKISFYERSSIPDIMENETKKKAKPVIEPKPAEEKKEKAEEPKEEIAEVIKQ